MMVRAISEHRTIGIMSAPPRINKSMSDVIDSILKPLNEDERKTE